MGQKVDYSSIRVKTAPAAEPVSVSELRDNLRLDDTSWDASMLPILIEAGRQAIENETGRTLIDTTYEIRYDEWPDATNQNWLDLPHGPIDSVTSIKYIDTDGDEQTWSSANYRVDLYSLPGRVTEAFGVAWPSIRDMTGAITIEYVAGYGTAGSSVPDALRQAVMLVASDLFENSEGQIVGTIAKINPTVQMLINTHKVPTIV